MKKRIIYLAAVFLLCFFGGGCGADRALTLNTGAEDAAGRSDQQAAEPPAGETGGPAGEEAGVIYVHVCGAVNEPQVVALPEGSRGCEAIEAAGGFSPDAAQTAVNLAERLEDGVQIYIPTREEAEAVAADGRAAESGLVDINRADTAQLCTLPGIGEARAAAIIEYREANGGFKTTEDIMQVPGIKEGAFRKIKDKIVIK